MMRQSARSRVAVPPGSIAPVVEIYRPDAQREVRSPASEIRGLAAFESSRPVLLLRSSQVGRCRARPRPRSPPAQSHRMIPIAFHRRTARIAPDAPIGCPCESAAATVERRFLHPDAFDAGNRLSGKCLHNLDHRNLRRRDPLRCKEALCRRNRRRAGHGRVAAAAGHRYDPQWPTRVEPSGHHLGGHQQGRCRVASTAIVARVTPNALSPASGARRVQVAPSGREEKYPATGRRAA